MHVVFYSGGVSSWGAAKRVVDRHGPDDVALLFADTAMEDEDLYRFLREGAEYLGAPVTILKDGRTPWELFRDVRLVGNTRVDPCSAKLKRKPMQDWVDEHCDPFDTTLYLGLDWTETNRLERYRKRNTMYAAEAPLMWEPVSTKQDVFGWLKDAGIEPPRLYCMGFQHNNCGGMCVKAGQAQFELLLRTMPERYRWHEEQERRTYESIGKRHPFLRMTIDGKLNYLTLREFREHLQRQPDLFDKHDWGGCGCALD